MTNIFTGNCHCGKISVRLHTNMDANELVARSDENTCSFCFANDGTWISDPNGKLEILKNSTEKQYVSLRGSGLWKACFCGECGTLCYGLFEDKKKCYAVIRAKIFDKSVIDLKKTVLTDFSRESDEDGRQRRKIKWTPIVHNS